MSDYNIDDAQLEAFDGEQKDVVLNLFKDMHGNISEAVDSKIEEAAAAAAPTNTVRDFDEKVARTTEIWKNAGNLSSMPAHKFSFDQLVEADSKRLADFSAGKIAREDFADSQFSLEQPLVIPRVISQIVRESVEPTIALTPLLQRINYSAGTSITFPAIGNAFVASDIPEGGEYPEATMEFAGQVTATIGKSGIAVKMTEEMIRYSMFDVMSMHLRGAGRALARHKEAKVSAMIEAAAQDEFNNIKAGGTRTTGRDVAGALNGTLSVEDLFRMYASMVDDGFVPNALIMHPYGWLSFAMNPALRQLGFHSNSGMFNAAQGGVGAAEAWRVGGLNQETKFSNPQEVATTMAPVPAGLPVPLRIIVSPFIPFVAASGSNPAHTDIYMVDTNELGVLVVDEDVTTDEFSDPARDIKKIKLRERYAVENINNGLGIRVARGVAIDSQYELFPSVQLTKAEGTSATEPGYFVS